ncbi:MAG: hypothetical protein SO435_09260 [Peptostreptococcus porci]|nr:hypothetical protein [Peptostreptococcus porci]
MTNRDITKSEQLFYKLIRGVSEITMNRFFKEVPMLIIAEEI